MISIMFVGHLGELALSSAMATSFAAVTGFSLLAGMACSLDTLCGQAFGAQQQRMLGVYKQRAMLVLGLPSVPVAAVWACTGRILLQLGHDPEIAAGAGSYIRWMIPTLFVYGPLAAVPRSVPPDARDRGARHAQLRCHGVQPRFGVLGSRGLRMGNKGAALANAVSFLTNLSILALYVRLSPRCRSTWTGFSREVFRGLLGFFKLAVPSALMVCTRVSKSSEWPRWGWAARVVMLLAPAVGASEGLAVLLLRNVWGYAYSNEEEVAGYDNAHPCHIHRFRHHPVLLGAVGSKRWALSSTSMRILSSVSLRHSFSHLSAILEEWGFGLEYYVV
ncbi:hypothetical protein BRADI_3g11205v3 [Brachypodium distachyon]|uniref:Protein DETOXIFICATION n=1 Tax=Brachypodium distachyon TaxID=15368 RepID=A0A2K2CWM2_BRADI|nr:hypothetical protein BRADI_3g11205v3 [Brachypodium distachyon]